MNPRDSATVVAYEAVSRAAGPDAETMARPDLSVLRLHRRPPPPLPLDVFGSRWSRWIDDAAHASACPVDYVAAPVLAAASALIGNARWAQATGGWAEPPHLWCASVGDSGTGKSPGADPLHRHVLPEMERRMVGDFPDRLREYRAVSELAEAAREQWERDIRTARKSGSSPPKPPQDADVGIEPMAPRLVQSDVTIEKVGLLLASAAPKGVLMVRDELAGWLLGMSAYNDGARPFWIEAYGGRTYRIERVKHPEPIVIPYLAVAWCGGMQPSRLAEIMREADDGLLARFCWFWPEPVLFRLGAIAPEIPWAIEACDRLRMLAMAPAAEAGAAPQPAMVPLSGAARDRMVALGREMQGRQDGAGGLMRSALGKARGLALRFSLVLAYLWWCAEPGLDAPPVVIPEAAFAAAALLVADYLMPMAERVYGDAACPARDRNAATLARWIAKERPDDVHVRHLLRTVRLPGLGEAERIHEAAAVLIEAGWLLPMAGCIGFQQRCRAAYPTNPQLWDALA